MKDFELKFGIECTVNRCPSKLSIPWNKVVRTFTPLCTVKSQINESRFNVKSKFKVQHLVTKMEFHIKKSRFKVLV